MIMNCDNPVNAELIRRYMNQTQLAKKINLSQSFVNTVINRKSDSEVTRRKIAHALGKPVAELFPEELK